MLGSFFMKFMRVGGLSAVNHKKYYKGHKDEEAIAKSWTGGFHIPPKKKGIYAFPFPYYEAYLILWSERHEKDIKTRGITKFEFDGNIWSHLNIDKPKNILEQKGSWFLTTMSVYEDALRRDIHYHNKETHKNALDENSCWYNPYGRLATNPYKQGEGGFYSRDHLEVFIDKRSIARIR